MSLPYTEDAFLVNTMETCFLVRLGQKVINSIQRIPFKLHGGDILDVGDMFERIDERGSAGNQPIILTAPWVQKYEGIVTVPESDPWYPNQDMVLFSALIPGGTQRFVSKPGHDDAYGTQEGYFIAYLRFGDGQLFHLRGGSGSSSVTQCNSIKRHYLK